MHPTASCECLLCNVIVPPTGKGKENQARSCHQEIVRQSKAALSVEDVTPDTSSINGYLAAAELFVGLKLPIQAEAALQLALGMYAVYKWDG